MSPSSIRYSGSVLLLTWILCAGSGLSRAAIQTSSTDACMSDPECATMCDRATERFRAGRHKEALALYQAAYALRPAARLLINIGRVQQKLGHHEDAINSYRKYLDTPASLEDPEGRTRAETFLREAEAAKPEAPAPELVNTKDLAIRAPERREPPPSPTPAYKRRWFWGVLGGVAAVTIVTVGLGVGLGTRPSTFDRTFN